MVCPSAIAVTLFLMTSEEMVPTLVGLQRLQIQQQDANNHIVTVGKLHRTPPSVDLKTFNNKVQHLIASFSKRCLPYLCILPARNDGAPMTLNIQDVCLLHFNAMLQHR